MSINALDTERRMTRSPMTVRPAAARSTHPFADWQHAVVRSQPEGISPDDKPTLRLKNSRITIQRGLIATLLFAASVACWKAYRPFDEDTYAHGPAPVLLLLTAPAMGCAAIGLLFCGARGAIHGFLFGYLGLPSIIVAGYVLLYFSMALSGRSLLQ